MSSPQRWYFHTTFKVSLGKEQNLLCSVLWKEFMKLMNDKAGKKIKGWGKRVWCKQEVLQGMLSAPPTKVHLCGSWQGTLHGQEGRAWYGLLAESLLILGIPFGERSWYIFVFQSIQQSKIHCCTLQAPGLWKSRRSPTKLNQIMSTVLRVAHKPEAHHCLPARDSN